VLTYSAIQIFGLRAGFLLPDLDLSVPRGYLFLKNGVWGLIGIITAAMLFFGWPRALQWTRGVVLLIGTWYWIDRWLCVQSDFTRRSWPAAAIITALIVVVVFWITYRKTVQVYYRENNV
jgi:hypothetical protein